MSTCPRIRRSNELAKTICQRIAGGEGLRKLCPELGFTREFVREWLNADAEFAGQYARAREEQADHYADEIIEISDAVEGCQKNEEVQAAKLRVESRKWTAAHLRPKKWGDRLMVDAEVNVRQMTDEQLQARATALAASLGYVHAAPGIENITPPDDPDDI